MAGNGNDLFETRERVSAKSEVVKQLRAEAPRGLAGKLFEEA